MMNTIFRRYIIGMFDVPAADRLLLIWTLAIGRLLLGLPVKFFITHVKVGLWLHRQWLLYWNFWFQYYLKRDTYWPKTQDCMFRNPLCPVGVWNYYKRMIFEMTPEELGKFLVGETERKLYRERQMRCGFAPQI